MTVPRYLSGTNGFVPSATGQVIAFVRDPKAFKVNEYVQLVNSPDPVGLYAVLDPDQQNRIVNDADFAWEDGNDAPSGNDNQFSFQWKEFRCFRRAYPYSIGEQAISAAKGWNPKAFMNAGILSQAMTNRTSRFITLLENTSNWGGNTADANALNGGNGKWTTASSDPTSPYYLAIRKSILEAVRQIVLLTNSIVQVEDLVMVISPGLALAMSETDEITAYLKNNQFGLDQVRGGKPGQNALWNLPDMYAGVKLVVEDASIVTVRQSVDGTTFAPVAATLANGQRKFIKSDSSAAIVSRKGGLDGNFGSPSFSTLQGYFYKYELAVESKDDSWNKKVKARVVEQFKEVLAATAAGYLITNTK